MDILFTNRKLPSIHSESVPRSRQNASTYRYRYNERKKLLIDKFHRLRLSDVTLYHIWRATREKGLSDVCVKCRFKLACAVRTG